ncbi:MAG TPA: hypothetical protein VN113_01990, partial [Caulobacter sp.]|nr:hypothetical protein [Caulobacter sp.]
GMDQVAAITPRRRAACSIAPDSRHDRRPDVPSKPSGEEKYGPALNADHSAGRKIDKRLIWLGSIPRTPRMEPAQSP